MLPADHSRTSSVASPSETPSWDLDDLMKNGQLDIDAVSEALGIGFSLSDHSSSVPATGTRSPFCNKSSNSSTSDSLLRKPGGPLCAIPEETDADESAAMDENPRPLSSLIERWGRVQRYQHQKFSVETSEIRESVSSSILEVDLSLLGIDVSAISGIGTPLVIARAGSFDRDTIYTLEAEDLSSSWQDDSTGRCVFGAVDENVVWLIEGMFSDSVGLAC